MRLVHDAACHTRKNNAYYYFWVETLAGTRGMSDEEFSILVHANKRMQAQVDRALGPDKGKIYTSEFNGKKKLILRVPSEIAKDENVRSLIGWIELFHLEDVAQPSEISGSFHLGNPGFAA